MEIGRFFLEKFAQEKRLLVQPLCQRMIRKHVHEFIPKGCGTTRLQNDHWRSRVNFRCEIAEDFLELSPGGLEKTEIVERSSAAHGCGRNIHFEAGGFENLDCRPCDLRIEIVREGIRPENDASCRGASRAMPCKPRLECLGCKLGKVPLRRDTGCDFREYAD